MKSYSVALCTFALAWSGLALAGPLTPEQWQQDLDELTRKIESIHPDPWHHVSRTEFHQQKNAIAEAIPNTGPVEIQVRMMQLVAALRDRHTALHPLDPGGFNHWLPINFYRFNDGFYVVAAIDTHAHLLGARVEKVGSHDVRDVFEQTADLHSSDNVFGRNLNTYYMSSMDALMALGLADDSRSIELTIRGEDGAVRVETVASVEIPFNLHDTKSYGEMFGPTDKELFPRYRMAYQGLNLEQWLRAPLEEKTAIPAYLRTRSGYWYEYLEEQKTFYMAVTYSTHDARNGHESFRAFLDEAFAVVDAGKVDKFILDIRFNPGGDGSTTLPLVHEFIKRDAINQPGRLFTLTGRKTYSAAQMIYAEMLKHTNTLLAGEPAGAPVNGYGDPGTYHLANSGMELNVSTAYWQMGHPNDESWHQPVDLPFEFTAEDYINGRDRAVEYILAIDDRYQGLPEVLRQSDAAAFKAEYGKREKLFGSYSWWKPFDERAMRYAARELYDAGETEKGMLGFEALVAQYPAEWRAWRDFARRMVKAGEMEKARKLIDKGLKVNPGSMDLQELKTELDAPGSSK